MRRRRLAILIMGILLLPLMVCEGAWAESGSGVRAWNFENVPVGKIPLGWRVEETGRGALATWEVVEESDAPSGTHVLALTKVNGGSWGAFNLCWTDQVSFLNGELTVKLRANTGRIDEGGGVIWRAKDRNNYYVARFNPLEDNFRIYYVKNGSRHQIASARVHYPRGQWVTMRIVQQGDRFEGYLNGKKLLEGTSQVFTAPGGVGLWTKADAATSFDDFQVRVK